MPQRLALLALLVLSACTEARVGTDDAACSSEAECGRLYRDALQRLQACLAEHKTAGYVGPGGPQLRNCDGLQAETTLRGTALSRFHIRKREEAADEQGGFEVPALPPAPSSAPAPPASTGGKAP